MRYILTTLILIAGLSTAVSAQKQFESFSLRVPEKKIKSSLYNRITLIDVRVDTTNLGYIQKGAFDSRRYVVADPKLEDQLNGLISNAAQEQGEGTLVCLLRKFKFVELSTSMSNAGSCFLRASLFVRSGEGYKKLGDLDTVVSLKGMDVTKGLLRQGGESFTRFITSHLNKTPSDQQYTMFEIRHTDSFEKRKIHVYNTDRFQDGLYTSWNTFREQTPDYPIKAYMKNGEVRTVKRLNEKGKEIPINPAKTYAIVLEGKPYIFTEFGFCAMEKMDDDFCFTGKVQATPDAGAMVAAGVFGGLVGGAIGGGLAGAMVQNASTDKYYMKIDHLTGKPVRIREEGTNRQGASGGRSGDKK